MCFGMGFVAERGSEGRPGSFHHVLLGAKRGSEDRPGSLRHVRWGPNATVKGSVNCELRAVQGFRASVFHVLAFGFGGLGRSFCKVKECGCFVPLLLLFEDVESSSLVWMF